MADVSAPKSVPCQFDKKGWASCKKPSDNGWCSEHEHLECCSCGQHAVQSCDAQMGGLACGASLCETCEHNSKSGKHITKAAADEIERHEREERKARKASRTSPVRRMNEELSVPQNLFELLKGDWQAEGFRLAKIYFLELEHRLMGVFPAVFSADKKRIIFIADLQLMERLCQVIEPRYAKLSQRLAYLNSDLGICYIDATSSMEREDRVPERLLTIAEFEDLVKAEQSSFCWASGLLDFNENPSQEYFLSSLREQALNLDPAFKRAVA